MLRDLLRNKFSAPEPTPNHTVPVRKYIKVWLKKRPNPPKKDGTCTVSCTLE